VVLPTHPARQAAPEPPAGTDGQTAANAFISNLMITLDLQS